MSCSHKYTGFTIIETMLVISITTLLFVGIIATFSPLIASHRYEDSVNQLTEYFREVYSSVESIQINRGLYANRTKCTVNGNTHAVTISDSAAGRTNCSVYGKIIFFDNSSDNTEMLSYDLIGDAVDHDNPASSLVNLKCGSGDTLLNQLCNLSLDYRITDTETTASDRYLLPWGGKVETTSEGIDYTSALMIVRSPADNSIHTFVITNANPDVALKSGDWATSQYQRASRSGDADLCYASPDSKRRSNIRIKADGNNYTAVQFVELDGDNLCE